MSKYNRYAKDLDAAFRAARKEYAEAWDKLQEASNACRVAGGDTMEQRRAELQYQQAELDFKEAEARIWPEFNRRRSELRSQLEREVRGDNAANPDAIDPNGMELLKGGILSADDFYRLAEKYDDNPTMLRFVAKYAKEAADDMDSTQAKERGVLYYLANICGDGQGEALRAWDELSHVVDYCSGQVHRETTTQHRIDMGNWWEQLSSDAVEQF